ncbi:MAG: rod shape-determining protein [Vicinamibacteria bacterium]|nr:rod shape-determining protein [Vicinamibacteria bacterium]
MLPYNAAVDLGTAYVRVMASGRCAPIEEPAVVRVSHDPLTLRAVGAQALAHDNGNPSTFLRRPLSKGVIVDGETAGWLLAAALRRARGLSITRHVVLVCMPSDANARESRLLHGALERAGVHQSTIVPEPLAAAVGAGLDLASTHAQLVVDVGEGVTDITIIREGQIEMSGAVRTACSDLRHAVVTAAAETRGVLIPEHEAERLLLAVADNSNGSHARRLDAQGYRTSDLAPVAAQIDETDIRDFLEKPLQEIIDAVGAIWSRLTPKASCEVIENGLCLSGGGARLRLLETRVREATGLDVHVAADPSRAVIRGASKMAGLG